MRVAVIVGFMDYHRNGNHHRGILQPQIGPLLAGLLPAGVEVEIINDTWEDPDWSRTYDLLFLSGLHPDFDRIRQISHYWRRRGTKTVFGGIMASTYPELCEPFFDAIVIGDPESSVPRLFDDFAAGRLRKMYFSDPYDPATVPIPRFDLLARKQIIPLSLEATRGCPFRCEFCALTGFGTRFQTRSPELIVRDIRAGQRMLRGLAGWLRRNWVVFNDNNIGGSMPWLKEFCRTVQPLGIKWGSAITFNVVANLEMVKTLSAAGCRFLFMGLESFNREALTDMHKVQNAVEKTRQVMEQCRDHGILVVSGLMLNPLVDDRESILSIPKQLQQCGLHVPSFISFESPIPGTPHFYRLAESDEPAMLPNAHLRDFTGYTLVTRPRRETIETFVGTFREIMRVVYSRRARMRKLADDLPRFVRGGYWLTVAVDCGQVSALTWKPNPRRTFIAGTDLEPPESRSVPLSGLDFASDSERRAVMEPFRVTDERGEVLPQWLRSRPAITRSDAEFLEAAPVAAGESVYLGGADGARARDLRRDSAEG